MSVVYIANGIIDEISSDRNSTLITVTYTDNFGNRGNTQTVRLVVGPRTIILDSDEAFITASSLKEGMSINAWFSSAMTRSMPPQSMAYLIEVANRPMQENETTGTILNVDRNNRSITTISDRDFSSIIQFNVSEDTEILDRMGRPISFARLLPGMRVRVRYADFMTASIPPQTIAFEIRIL